MKQPVHLTVTLMMLVGLLPAAFAYDYQGARWRLEDLPIPCYFNAASVPKNLAPRDVEQAVVESLLAWNRAAELEIFAYAGWVELDVSLVNDGVNAISFILENWAEVTEGTSATNAHVGVTCKWNIDDTSNDPSRHDLITRGYLGAFDIALNAERFNWATGAQPGYYDVQSVVTHELGHVLSLGHTEGDYQAPDVPTMVARVLPNDTKWRTLEPDDIAGARSIYRKVSGVLAADAIWTNTVWVVGDVTVPHGVRLTVDSSTPPTTVHFSPGTKLIIEGGLTVSESRETIFTGIDGELWSGLEIRGNNLPCQIEDSRFENTTGAPVVLKDATDVAISDCQFTGHATSVLAHNSHKLSITGCVFSNAQVAIDLRGTIDVFVENCEFNQNAIAVRATDSRQLEIGGVFLTNGVGVSVQSSREAQVNRSAFDENEVGIRLVDTEAHVYRCTMTNNDIGVETQSAAPVRLRENNITGNNIGVQVLGGVINLGQSPDDLGRNNLLGNMTWNLALTANAVTPVLAQGNHWAGLTAKEIDRTIRDNDEAPNLPNVQFEPMLDEWVPTNSNFELVGFEPGPFSSTEVIMDRWAYKPGSSSPFGKEDGRWTYTQVVIDDAGNEREVKSVGAQSDGGSPGFVGFYDAKFRVVNLDPRLTGFSIEAFVSTNAKTFMGDAVSLTYGYLRRPGINTTRALDGYFEVSAGFPDLPINGVKQDFYVWAKVFFDGQETPVIVPGKWVTVYEELADLVGTIHNIPPSAMPGEEINVRYSVKNYGLVKASAHTVRFYLAKVERHSLLFAVPKSDYFLQPEIRLEIPEGEWTAKLTIPPDVAHGQYHLWMMVDADNDVLEFNSANNPATYLANPIQIGNVEEEPQAVLPRGKQPVVWGELKTALYQNYPNPFNPETWIPYQLAQQTPVRITICNR